MSSSPGWTRTLFWLAFEDTLTLLLVGNQRLIVLGGTWKVSHFPQKTQQGTEPLTASRPCECGINIC